MNGGVETALVIGTTSDIGRAIAYTLAEDGCALQLAARDPTRLEREARDIRARTGVPVTAYRCDVLEEDGGVSLLDTLDPLPDVVVCVVGLLGDQAESERDGAAAELVMRTNYVGPALLLGAMAERFGQRGSGVLVGVSSVAGERKRAANYVYGSAKAGFTAFISGLRSRLAAFDVHVVTVKPGFVHTRTTDEWRRFNRSGQTQECFRDTRRGWDHHAAAALSRGVPIGRDAPLPRAQTRRGLPDRRV